MNATFKKNHTYTARNYRTHETFNVTCTRRNGNGTYFMDANGHEFKTYTYDSAVNYNLYARNNREHIIVKTVA